VDLVISGSHDGLWRVATAQEHWRPGPLIPHARADREADCGQYDLYRHLDEVSQELRAAYYNACHGTPVRARRPSEAFRTAQASIDNQPSVHTVILTLSTRP